MYAISEASRNLSANLNAQQESPEGISFKRLKKMKFGADFFPIIEEDPNTECMAYTGGLLNLLNGKMGISAPYKSVPVMSLIRRHNPKSKEELVELIDWHSKNKCACGIVSQGSVEDFGTNLYNSQLKFWGEYRFSLKECIQWEYDLFVVQSLKGGIIEKKAKACLEKELPQFRFEDAEGYLDEELRIDLVIKDPSHEVIGGIQVKPATFMLMRREVITFSRTANESWGHPVYYLYYNGEEEFVNLMKVVEEVRIMTS